MKTPVEMQLKILDKMRENVEKNINMMTGIEYEVVGKWYEVRKSLSHVFNMNVMEYRVKPETITINGVEIPKPLTKEQVGRIPSDIKVYGVWSLSDLNIEKNPIDCYSYMTDTSLIYSTKEEAIEASKALFGITG